MWARLWRKSRTIQKIGFDHFILPCLWMPHYINTHQCTTYLPHTPILNPLSESMIDYSWHLTIIKFYDQHCLCKLLQDCCAIRQLKNIVPAPVHTHGDEMIPIPAKVHFNKKGAKISWLQNICRNSANIVQPWNF